jgi:hypothetical protein
MRVGGAGRVDGVKSHDTSMTMMQTNNAHDTNTVYESVTTMPTQYEQILGGKEAKNNKTQIKAMF